MLTYAVLTRCFLHSRKLGVCKNMVGKAARKKEASLEGKGGAVVNVGGCQYQVNLFIPSG
jgi:hypothetical protein